MIINSKNYLLLKKRGCNYHESDDICTRSDVGNYRVFVEFTDKNGVKVCGDLQRGYKREYNFTGKKHKVLSDIVLCADFQYEDERGAWRYHPEISPDGYTFNLGDILQYINAISAEQYDSIKWIERIETTNQRGANFTPAAKIHEYAKKHRLSTSNSYGNTILHLYTGNYKYLACNIQPMNETTEKVTIIMEEA